MEKEACFLTYFILKVVMVLAIFNPQKKVNLKTHFENSILGIEDIKLFKEYFYQKPIYFSNY